MMARLLGAAPPPVDRYINNKKAGIAACFPVVPILTGSGQTAVALSRLTDTPGPIVELSEMRLR